MVLAPEHPLVEQITTPEQRAAVEAYREHGRAQERPRAHRAGEGKDRRLHRRVRDQPGQRTSASRSGSPTTCSWATAPARSWPCRRTTSATWSSRRSSTCRSASRRAAQTRRDARNGQDGRRLRGVPTAARSCFVERRRTPIHSPASLDWPADRRGEGSKITAWLEEQGLGKSTINYKLRDWLFTRQRYWGEPFPIVWEDGQHRAHRPRANCRSCRRRSTTSSRPAPPSRRWRRPPTGCATPTPRDARDQHHAAVGRLVLVLPALLRPAERASASSAKKRKTTGWAAASQPGGVDLYVGGTEHAVLHLLYARFWHKVLFDLGHVSTPEPFQRLVNQGLILGEDGQKMSQVPRQRRQPRRRRRRIRRGRPAALRDVHGPAGADEAVEHDRRRRRVPFSGARLAACSWRKIRQASGSLSPTVQLAEPTAAQRRVVHATIKKVTDDIEALAFNTAISQMMIFVNEFTSAERAAGVRAAHAARCC